MTLRSIIKPQPPLITTSIGRDTLYALPQGPTRWFRNGLPVFGGTNGVLPVSLAGTYYAVRDSIVGTILCTSDSSNRVYKSGVFVSNENISNVIVFPNPTNGILNLKSDYFFNSKDFEFKLVTSTGMLIQNGYSLSRKDYGYEVNLLDLPNSVYFIHINDEKSKAIVKVVLRR
ncbi:MAG: T9SS C-terminal target domain-containing protein [Sphingobacteriia bacterium]|nr:T9SS C-terminal target domain-containing protein [Sphingobacteriia bacterium]